MSLWCIGFLSLMLLSTTIGNKLGDECPLTGTNIKGTCKVVTNCESALSSLRNGKRPQSCKSSGPRFIVCCGPSPVVTEETIISTPPTSVKSTRMPGVISKEKCKEYSKYVISKEKPPVLIDADEIENNECGILHKPLIIGGLPAEEKEFPHMALIGSENKNGIYWNCGGSIISENYILTAAHCLHFENETHVKVGITKLEDTLRMQEIRIKRTIKHHQFKPPMHYNDIGLIELEKPIDLNPYARPACLEDSPILSIEHAIITGWGKTLNTSESKDLLKTTVDLFPTSNCTKSYKTSSYARSLKNGITDTLICAGSQLEEKDACQGDSGGPLQTNHDESHAPCMYDIVGIISFGKFCGQPGIPGVYTKVSSYIKWIEDIVWPEV